MIRITTKALIGWLVMMTAESIHGVLRRLFLVPYVGDSRARQIGAIVGTAIILAIAYLGIEWIGAKSSGALCTVGVLWLVLSLSFEFSLGRFAFGYSWERMLADYDIRRGGLLLFGMLLLTLAPWISLTLRSRTQSRFPALRWKIRV